MSAGTDEPIFLSFSDYQGFPFPANKNKQRISILQVKIHKLNEKILFLNDAKVKKSIIDKYISILIYYSLTNECTTALLSHTCDNTEDYLILPEIIY